MSSRINRILKVQYFFEILKIAKESYPWIEISKHTGLSASALSRYLHGKVFPNEGKMDRLTRILEELIDLESVIKSRLSYDKHGFLNNQKLISDVSLLKILALKYASKYIGKVDTVLSPSADGIPYATLIAEYMRVPLIIAKSSKEVGVDRFVECSMPTLDGSVVSLYFPRFLIRKNYRVLIVDDVIRTGRTHECLINMVKSVKAYPVAIHVIVAIGSSWRDRIKDVDVDPITIVS